MSVTIFVLALLSDSGFLRFGCPGGTFDILLLVAHTHTVKFEVNFQFSTSFEDLANEFSWTDG